MNKSIIFTLGFLTIIFGVFVVFLSIKSKYNKSNSSWDYQMRFKGIVGGSLFVFLGIKIISNAS